MTDYLAAALCAAGLLALAGWAVYLSRQKPGAGSPRQQRSGAGVEKAS